MSRPSVLLLAFVAGWLGCATIATGSALVGIGSAACLVGAFARMRRPW